jgi:hypothetical protein
MHGSMVLLLQIAELTQLWLTAAAVLFLHAAIPTTQLQRCVKSSAR